MAFQVEEMLDLAHDYGRPITNGQAGRLVALLRGCEQRIEELNEELGL